MLDKKLSNIVVENELNLFSHAKDESILKENDLSKHSYKKHSKSLFKVNSYPLSVIPKGARHMEEDL